jgi:hypothetical protein
VRVYGLNRFPDFSEKENARRAEIEQGSDERGSAQHDSSKRDKFTGVRVLKNGRLKKYKAYLVLNNKLLLEKAFYTMEEAALAWDKAVLRYGAEKHYKNLNFLDCVENGVEVKRKKARKVTGVHMLMKFSKSKGATIMTENAKEWYCHIVIPSFVVS